MSAPAGCCTPCQSIEVTNVPGTEGATGPAGANGTNGGSSFTLLDGALTLPAVGAAVTSGGGVDDNSWMVIGEVVVSGDGTDFGTFRVTSKTGTTQVGLTFLGAPGDSSPGAIIADDSIISPGGAPQSTPLTVATGGTGAATLTDRSVLIGRGTAAVNFAVPGAALYPLLSTGAATNPAFGPLVLTSGTNVTGQLPIANVALAGALPTAITDNSTGAVSSTFAAGVGVSTVVIPIQLASMTALAADLVTAYTPGYAFKVLALHFATTTIGAGAAASQVLNLEIGSTDLTGGLLTITLAGTDTLGELTTATAITAANTGTAADTISVEVAAGGTIFTAGDGVLLVKLQNMDTANAFASISSKINTLITDLT